MTSYIIDTEFGVIQRTAKISHVDIGALTASTYEQAVAK